MKNKLIALTALMMLFSTLNLAAGPQTVDVNIASLRPLVSSTGFYVEVDSTMLTDGNNCTDTYLIEGLSAGADTVTISAREALLAGHYIAYALGKTIQIVPTTAGCTGYGTKNQGIFLN